VHLENYSFTYFPLQNKDNELKRYSSAPIAAKPCYKPSLRGFVYRCLNNLLLKFCTVPNDGKQEDGNKKNTVNDVERWAFDVVSKTR
jgi:hypothetical protein